MAGSVVIVGGGVVGCSTAYYLARAGWNVTIVDKGRIGGGCSHGNCGYVSPSHVLPHAGPGALQMILRTLFQRNSPVKVRPKEMLRSWSWFFRFARKCNIRDRDAAATAIRALLVSARTKYDEIIAQQKLACEWDPCGMFFVFQTQAALDHYAEINHLLADRFDMPAERVEAAELIAREPALRPEAVSGAYFYPNDAQLRPDRLMSEWRRLLEQRGVRLLENVEFRGLNASRHTASGIKTSTHGDIPADAVVVAAGAWTPLLQRELGCKIPVIPGKGFSITMDKPAVCPRFPLIFEEHRVAVSPFGSGFRVGSTMEFAGYDETMNQDRLRLLRDGAAMYLKDSGAASKVREEWWGWRPMSADGLPIIDRTPKFGNVIVAAGHGMLGLSMAPATGQLVAELLAGSTPHIDPRPYSFRRFGRMA